MMNKKIISVLVVFVMLCLSLAGCGCEASTPPVTVDSDAVAEEKINELMNKFSDALNNQDKEAYNSLTTDNMRASDNDINTHFDQVTEFILKTVAFDSKNQKNAKYNILVHYYVTFSRDYTGKQYKVGISNMSNTFTFVKEGDVYKIDSINYYK